jgi:carbon-monoxide dehydrogenase medium subunit
MVPEYTRPETIDESLEMLDRVGESATVLAGGQDVVPLMNQGRLIPQHIVDISHLPGLDSITSTDRVTIGALVTHSQLLRDPIIRERVPLLAEAARQIGGGIQVRNRGTIGGALCAANPVYDLPTCLVALDAHLILRSAIGERRIAASAFFLGAGKAALTPRELVIAIDIPLPPPSSGWSYEKLKFTEGGYTIVGAACLVVLASDGTCLQARVAVGGVEELPLRMVTVEESLVGHSITDNVLGEASSLTSSRIADPISDVMADSDYRKAMAGIVLSRGLQRAAGCAARRNI